jgi:peptide deformylase
MGKWPDPILRRSADPVDESYFNSDVLQQTCDILRNTAVAEGAVGLAAQQCGINARIIYLEVPSYGRNAHMILINPKIEDRSPEINMITWREQCLVLPPTFHATVLRDAWVDVSYYGMEKMGQRQKNTTSRRISRLYGEMARAIQHEMDHDRGILVTDHVSLDELESDLMRSIELPGHEQRMQIAYSRNW